MKAIELLARDRNSRHTYTADTVHCPIARTYGIVAFAYWDDLKQPHQEKLINVGWSTEEYEDFIEWFDGSFRGRSQPITWTEITKRYQS